jgi:hypothetical protein
MVATVADQSTDAKLGREAWDVGHQLATRALAGAVVAIDAGTICAEDAVAELARSMSVWMADLIRSDLPEAAVTGRVLGAMETLSDLALVGIRAVRAAEQMRGGEVAH